VIGLSLAGCPLPQTASIGCGKDTDCKGTRICYQRTCVDPSGGRPSVSPDGGLEKRAPVTPAKGPPIPPPSASGPSPQFHVDPAHSGRSRFRAPAKAPQEVMRVGVGGVVFSSPAVADGMVVFGSHDKTIYGAALDGAVRWRFPTGDLIWSSPALGPGGVVYVGSDDDHLYALDVKSGVLKWQLQAGPCRTAVGIGPEASRCDVDGVTVGEGGTVYAAADGLYAVAPDGALRWKFQPGTTHCATHPAVGADGTIYIGCQDDALYAVDPFGQKKWEYRTADDVDSSPAVSPDGTVYFGSDDHKLYAVAPGGILKFAVLTGGPVRSSPALGGDGTVYAGSFDGALYAVKPDGAVAWTFRTADRVVSSPVIDAAGMILVGSGDDRLYAIQPDGKLAWSVLLDGDVDGTPALGEGGVVYVGSDDRALHALR
jgi:outer membrane protein assembly factor BamB